MATPARARESGDAMGDPAFDAVVDPRSTPIRVGLARLSPVAWLVFLAGGLTPENVAEAVRIVRPYAVDVCSGVEARLRRKDDARVKALMRAVRETPKRKR